MQDLAALSRFAIPGRIAFRSGPGGLLFADLEHPEGQAQVCLQGGHLTAFHTAEQAEPVVWLSERSRFAPGKSIRGGVPVCWPWFGAHATEADFPAHGFARTAPWDVIDASADGVATVLTLALRPDPAFRALWPHDTPLSLRVAVSAALDMALTTHNAGAEPVLLGEALHTYFRVGDIGQVALDGLDGCGYLDKTLDFGRSSQSGAVRFSAETDRVYVNTAADCVIEDPLLGRRIRIAKAGSASTVVWTPWAEKAAAMGDFTPEGWRGMLCVESGNAWDDLLTLPPGECHTLSVRYTAEPL